MKISGIICEYNPFHNGHLHHIKQTRANGATHIVAVMSGNFVQRGDVAIINKFERAKAAIQCGVDLVIELPVAYCLSNAEQFADAAVYLLHQLHCVDELSFGSECGDTAILQKALEATKICQALPEHGYLMKNGCTYPKATQILIRQNYGDEMAALISQPNNILALEYLNALQHRNSTMQPFTIKRSVPHDSTTISDSETSASMIRTMLKDQFHRIHLLVPNASEKALWDAVTHGEIARMETLERLLLYRLRTVTKEELKALAEIGGQGLENKILEAQNAIGLEEMFQTIKSKRYLMSRLRRLLLNLLIGITAEDTKTPPPYARILALSERGSDIINAARDHGCGLPFATSLVKLAELNDICKACTELEARSTSIYTLAQDKVGPANADYKAKIAMI